MAYNPSMKNVPVTVIEPPSFRCGVKGLMGEEECLELISFLAFNPDAGDVLEGAGGVRKLRWARQGGGKSGGFCVIYFFHSGAMPLFALSIYGKNQKANLTKAERNEIKRLSAMLVAAYTGRRT